MSLPEQNIYPPHLHLIPIILLAVVGISLWLYVANSGNPAKQARSNTTLLLPLNKEITESGLTQ